VLFYPTKHIRIFRSVTLPTASEEHSERPEESVHNSKRKLWEQLMTPTYSRMPQSIV